MLAVGLVSVLLDSDDKEVIVLNIIFLVRRVNLKLHSTEMKRKQFIEGNMTDY